MRNVRWSAAGWMIANTAHGAKLAYGCMLASGAVALVTSTSSMW
jgi:hypothetical protein